MSCDPNFSECPLQALERVFSSRESKADPYTLRGTNMRVGSRDVKYRLDAAARAYQRVFGLPDVTAAMHALLDDVAGLWRARAKSCEDTKAAREAVEKVFGL